MQVSPRMALILTICLASLSAVSVGQHGMSSSEQELFNSINRERQAHGLPALKWSNALAVAARKHATAMARQESLSHQFPGEASLPGRAHQAGGHFVSLSENVAEGADASLIHAQFVKSPKHHANILDTDMNSIGVGVVERNGQLFAVEDFSKAN